MVPKHASMCLFTRHEAAEAQVNKRIVSLLGWVGRSKAGYAPGSEPFFWCQHDTHTRTHQLLSCQAVVCPTGQALERHLRLSCLLSAGCMLSTSSVQHHVNLTVTARPLHTQTYRRSRSSYQLYHGWPGDLVAAPSLLHVSCF